ncbi:BTAD domain-containing putative transcriptional regulator, partial [Nonomuraea basaltis]|uniref:BTAD domain-containing putative transcriptional regulator n=1 Tax=Nonomuraea basaltis TaxID=2495887 RepID=UPI0014875A72
MLGPLTAAIDGDPVDLGRPRQRSVVARLLAARGHVVPVDRLIDDLYDEAAPPRALAAVQAYVSRLRRALEPGRPPRSPAAVLVTVPPGYAMRLDVAAVDAWQFEDAVRSGAGLRNAAEVHRALAAALRLWHGPPYQEFAGMHWADPEITRLEELRLTAIERHAAAAIRLGLAAQVVPDLERLVGEHPLREGAWGSLARALYRCGRQGEALAALRRARAHLAEELGVDPGPELRRLEEDILAQAPHLTETADEPPAETPAARPHPVQAAHPVARPALIGRAVELARLTAAADGAAVRHAKVALVVGEPGAGKTTLIEE